MVKNKHQFGGVLGDVVQITGMIEPYHILRVEGIDENIGAVFVNVVGTPLKGVLPAKLLRKCTRERVEMGGKFYLNHMLDLMGEI